MVRLTSSLTSPSNIQAGASDREGANTDPLRPAVRRRLRAFQIADKLISGLPCCLRGLAVMASLRRGRPVGLYPFALNRRRRPR